MKNQLQTLFRFDPATMSLKKEMVGGITTFLTMAYILAVQPALLSQSGMDAGAVFTATILSSIVATVIMGLYAKLPFALAPAMGLNAFFVYTIVLTMGYSWQFALTAVFIEGIIFVLLTLSGLRNKIVEAMPLQLRKAISPGIGLFITFIGLHNAGIITGSEATLVTLGNLHTPSVLLALFGILLSAVLLVRRITGALLIGILATTIIGIPMGLTHLGGFVSAPPSLSPIFCKMEWSNICSMDMVICVFTLLFMDMFDTLGTLIGVGQRAGMVEKNGYMHGLNKAFMADAIGTTFGALVGTSTVSTYVESAAGVNAGGRSGLTAIVVAACFVLAMFFSPLFLAIPSQATAPAMILVGVMMMGDIKDIDFQDFLTAIPCFLCIVLMPMTYSISNGILMGLICWVVLHLLSGQVKSMKASTLILAVLFVLKYIFL
ncbi:MAG: NCS2 family permease [Prevotella sp.]|nr:NCS2 family permease [Prevotella sp.]MDD7045543.1 NCS2 family permease [Prevotella sp.]MDY5546159.1 NCS2 family permease [Prevotella sp.]